MALLSGRMPLPRLSNMQTVNLRGHFIAPTSLIVQLGLLPSAFCLRRNLHCYANLWKAPVRLCQSNSFLRWLLVPVNSCSKKKKMMMILTIQWNPTDQRWCLRIVQVYLCILRRRIQSRKKWSHDGWTSTCENWKRNWISDANWIGWTSLNRGNTALKSSSPCSCMELFENVRWNDWLGPKAFHLRATINW